MCRIVGFPNLHDEKRHMWEPKELNGVWDVTNILTCVCPDCDQLQSHNIFEAAVVKVMSWIILTSAGQKDARLKLQSCSIGRSKKKLDLAYQNTIPPYPVVKSA